MTYLYLILTSLDVLSVRIPVFGSGLKLVYLAQIALVAFLVIRGSATKLRPWERRASRPYLICQILLLLAVCIPILLNEGLLSTTRNYTLVLASWVVTFFFVSLHIRVSVLKFLRTYIFSIVFLLGLSIPAFLLIDDQRIDSIFGGGTNRLGLYAVIGMLVSYYILSKKLDTKYSTVYKAGVFICVLALVFTFSRSAILALLVAMLEHGVRNKILKLSHVVAISTLAGCTAFYLNYMYTSTNDIRYLNLMVRFGINDLLGHVGTIDIKGISRVVHYQSALDAVLSSWDRLLFGMGLESYRSEEFLANQRGKDLALHSLYLQYLVGGGLFAITTVIAYVALLFKGIYRLKGWQSDLCCFILVPSLVHAAFQPAIFSREIFLFTPMLIVSFLSLNAHVSTRKRDRV